jgi:hypothetical protein
MHAPVPIEYTRQVDPCRRFNFVTGACLFIFVTYFLYHCLMHVPDEENTVFNTAADFINNSNHPVFLTGKAGTGKTSFLKHIKENTLKNTVIVAPTGVAAINAGGTTIHSFFQIPFGPYIPVTKKEWGNNEVSDRQNLLEKLRLSGERKALMQELELLIIDEISMVRCDVLDAIDAVLRYVRNRYDQPFGGVQVLYIGDMYQLPPVIREEEWKILSAYYGSPFFFSSHVSVNQPPVYIELKKVYRQSDPAFIQLLNQVRNNDMDEAGYTLLHSRLLTNTAPPGENVITLSTHNHKADTINDHSLEMLQEKLYTFKAAVEGEFSEKSFPAEEFLRLKAGAQVMFIKNDTEKVRRYFNGKIGSVQKVENDKIFIECADGESKIIIEVKKEVWRNIKYSLNKKTNQIDEEELGSFTQYPLRLAWAITIHKSQGLTFEKAIIDAGDAFAPGQVYVALSRCTGLDGLFLKNNISYKSLHSDDRIVAFAKTQQNTRSQERVLEDATQSYQQILLMEMIGFQLIEQQFDKLRTFVQQNSVSNEVREWIKKLQQHIDIYIKHSRKFGDVLHGFFLENLLPENNAGLQQRFSKAAAWFFEELAGTKALLLQSPFVSDNRQLSKDYLSKLQPVYDAIVYKMHLLSACRNGFVYAAYLEQKKNFENNPMPVSAYAGKAVFVPKSISHPALYTRLKDKRDELCAALDLPVYMVCGSQSLEEMSNFLPLNLKDLGKVSGFGKIKLKQFGGEFIGIIKDYAAENHLQSSMDELPVKKIKRPAASTPKPDTKLLTFDLYQQGKTISEIAMERNLAGSTIESHLAYFIENGSLHIDTMIGKEKRSVIQKVIAENSGATLSELKVLLPDINFGELKWVLAANKAIAVQG